MNKNIFIQKIMLGFSLIVLTAGNGFSQTPTTFTGNAFGTSDNSFFGWDNTTTANPALRLGFMKKSGWTTKLAYASGASFVIAQASAGTIDPGLSGNNFTDRLIIDGIGRVGIGIAPTYLLDLGSASPTSTVIGLRNFSTGAKSYALTSEGSASGLGAGTFTIWDVTSNTPRLVINAAGNVGIGTLNPDKGALHIKGSFHVESDSFQVFHVSSKKALVFVGKTAYQKYQQDSASGGIISQNKYSLWVSEGIVSENYAVSSVANWSDYVFDKKYALPSLQKLEQYISVNKHLPAIPSEADVKKNGYNMVDLDNGFLKTLEELTLYAIDQEKKIDGLKDAVSDLQQKMKGYEQLAGEVETLKANLRSQGK